MAITRIPNPLAGAVTEEVDPTALKTANDLSDLANAATARSNLSLGTAATVDTGTGIGDLALLVDVGGGTPGLPAIDGSNLTGIAGGGGASEASLGTVSTGNVVNRGGTSDISFALPAGVTSAIVTRATIERTAGTGTSAGVAAYTKDDRSDDPRFIFGDAFTGVTVDPGPILGPASSPGGSLQFFPINYINVDGSEFVRVTVTNQDFSNDATYDVSLWVLPI